MHLGVSRIWGYTMLPCLSYSKECDSANLYTLTKWRVRRGCRVIEGGVTHKTGPAVYRGVEGLQENDLVRSHLGEIPPFMSGRMAHDIVLAVAIAIAEIELKEVLRRRRGDVAHG